MATVQTVTGPVDQDALGTVAMHEHLIVDLRHSVRGFVAELGDVDLAIEEAERFRQAGGDTLVETTSIGAGRDIRKLQQVAIATGLNVVAGTGFYLENYYPPDVDQMSILQLADLITRELLEGVGDTGIRPGVIGEIGTGRSRISPAEERVFRAAARAQRRTGVAITTHTHWGGELALEQVAILFDEGVPPERIIIGHLGDKRDLDHYAAIAQAGVFVQFDHLGMQEYQTDAVRARIIGEMLSRGFERQLLLSCDVSYKSHLHAFGGRGYDYLLTGFRDALAAAGVDEATFHSLTVENPRRALSGA